jgi:hypothetical protein
MDILPHALFIGPMKSGTTFVYKYLESRGDICLPRGVKETFFFDSRFEKGIDWYRSHFRHYHPASHKCILEVAPSYFHNREAPERIQKHLGAIPLVITLRDPVSRSWSHYLHLRRKGYTCAPFLEAVEQYPEIVEASCYATFIQRWQKVFGKNHIHILFLEDLTRNEDEYLRRLCVPLGLDYHQVQGLQKENPAGMSPSFILASFGRRAANTLRKRRLYFVVNAAKHLGLKQVFFGGSVDADALPKPDALTVNWLRARLSPEIQALESFFDKRLDIWSNSPFPER